MPTYTISQFKARAGEILDSLRDGEEVIITRRGKPCAKLTVVTPASEKKRSLVELRGAYRDILPDLTFEEIQDGIRDMRRPKSTDCLNAE